MKHRVALGCLVAGLLSVGEGLAAAPPAGGTGDAPAKVSGVPGVAQGGGGIEKAAGLGARTGAPGVPPEAPNSKVAQSAGTKPPPPPSSVAKGGGITSRGDSAPPSTASSIRPVRGLSGITAPKIQNLEAALLIKRATPAPDAPLDRKSKAAAAGLMSGSGEKPDPKGEKKPDGRGGFQEFEKLDTSGS